MKVAKRGTLEILALFILVLLLTAVLWPYLAHEPAHYIAGAIQGKECSLGIPPRVDCKDIENFTAGGYLVLFLAPYLLSLAAMLLLSGNNNKFIRLIPYTAFFDIQSNLTMMQLENALLGLRGGDGFKLLSRIDNLAPELAAPALLLIWSLIALSWLIFYKKYKDDFVKSKDRMFFRAAFFIFLFYQLIDLLYVVFFIFPRIPK